MSVYRASLVGFFKCTENRICHGWWEVPEEGLPPAAWYMCRESAEHRGGLVRNLGSPKLLLLEDQPLVFTEPRSQQPPVSTGTDTGSLRQLVA